MRRPRGICANSAYSAWDSAGGLRGEIPGDAQPVGKLRPVVTTNPAGSAVLKNQAGANGDERENELE